MAEKFEFNDEQDEKFQFDDDQNKRFQFNDDEEIENSNINNDDIETFDNDDERLDYSNNKKREKNKTKKVTKRKTKTKVKKQKEGRSKITTFFMILLILLLIGSGAVGAYFVYRNNQDQENKINQLQDQVDEQNKTITFTSFNVTNDPDGTYESFDLPLIKLNVPYNISNDGKSFAINLYIMDGVDELPFVDVGELANFEIKK